MLIPVLLDYSMQLPLTKTAADTRSAKQRVRSTDASIVEEPPGFPREAAGERQERDSQAKRQSRSPRSKVERDEIPGDGTRERRYVVPALHVKMNSFVSLCFWQLCNFALNVI